MAAQSKEPISAPAVVITGCSSGIGYGTVRVLAQQGFKVFGSVRKLADGERLRQELGEQFTPLLFDVTDEKAVAAAAHKACSAVQCSARTQVPLDHIIVNAGQAGLGWSQAGRPGEQCRRELSWPGSPPACVRVPHPPGDQHSGHFHSHPGQRSAGCHPSPDSDAPHDGVMHTCSGKCATMLHKPCEHLQAFLPLLGTDGTLRGSPGRIINVSSTSGSYGAPFMGAYAASKHAMQGYTDSLRRELLLFGVDVILVGVPLCLRL